MTRIIKASLHYPVVTVLLTMLVVSAGIHALLTMPRTEDPTITIRTGLVLAEYPGATSEQVEQQVTRVIEDRLFTFAEVRKDKTFSTSRPGLAVINVELQGTVTNADVFWSKLRQSLLVLAQTSLPRGIRGPIVNSDFGDTVALLIAIHGRPYDYRQLHDYGDRIQDELRGISDVGRLLTYGGQTEQIRITGDLGRISQYLTDPGRIIQALQQRNVVLPSGTLETGAAAVPLRTTGAFTTEEQIRNMLVDVSRTGQPVYIRDFGEVERRYQDPTYVVRYDGETALLLSVEMQKGRNIVQMGEQVNAALDRMRSVLPPDLKLDLIANQPAVVKHRISDLSREFLLAIGSVILVTIILLPIRVASIAALAIPVTVCATLAVMNAIGVQLHQVSIAALIVVLGIVVDDAIVIADNYLELLDHGVPRSEAAWRSAADVLVPVLTATLTIISSFLPLLILKGSTGEFIWALPITVTTALTVSFVVAIVLTPILCRTFIKTGLRAARPDGGPRRRGALDLLQSSYHYGIRFLMRHRIIAVGLAVIAVLAGVGLFQFVPRQFFPSAERNQFVIDVWMREGTRIEATDKVMRRIEQTLRTNQDVAHFATFIGQSAPRFYYNVNPQQPDPAYGQFVVNTTDADRTPELVAHFRQSLARTAPEALVVVRELQQGALLDAPVEVRIYGDDIGTLKQLGRTVEDLVRRTGRAEMVHNDYLNDVLTVDVNVHPELANRLGISNALVSQLLAGGINGVPVGTFWEGDRAITLMLRLDPEHRTSFEDVRNAYVISPVTQARVPLRSVAALKPEWQPSRIVRRNGIRTLTVRAFPHHGQYASDLLDAVDTQLKSFAVPAGYRIEYGGEIFNQRETFPQMLNALAISLLAIFLVMLVQFRNIADPLVIMCSIPLALFGAVFGLWITRNPFGFTAFMGLISLAGIVVRNAIILVEYVHERMRAGATVAEAATEAGERRLRPIFLTTMAAAVGVTPMIVSQSSLWSPLASVIALGLVFSMFFTLLAIPVIFVIVRRRLRPSVTAVVTLLCLLAGIAALNAEPRRLTVDEAISLALKQNTGLKIQQARVRENGAKHATARANYFPQLTNDSYMMRTVNQQQITIPSGGLGVLPQIGAFPTSPLTLAQGSQNLMFLSTTLGQPLTQVWKIREGDRLAASEKRLSEVELSKAQQDVAYGVRQLYYGALAATKAKSAAEAAVTARREALREADNAVKAGNALDVTVMAARAAVLKAEQTVLEAENQRADLIDELNNAAGLPLNTELELVEPEPAAPAFPKDEYVNAGLTTNPGIRAAAETVHKAESGVRAARYEYIPEVGAFARHIYQAGVPFLANNNGAVGLQMTLTLFDWGKRRSVVQQREAQLEQATLNLQRTRERITVDVEKAYRKLDRAKHLVEVAEQALAAQKENRRIVENQVKAGYATEAKRAEIAAGVEKAEFDAEQARLSLLLAEAELKRLSGL
ncbi:MAG: efflux RND transporter permease subunit [Bryobacterales bacterium]|nr:efflux RND transporter permease subunit [Bryobacterales bacterium]